ncbi:LanC-like protein [Bacteriovorax sp. Seq25_V]|uniref:lanthionine synthetase C family protein n=1 Tax=Bacteriovorax sp. Seq25_V TaxID=1201288 RepID=UPI00038A3087|nr:LanC-like protein [Bacteriovorax sp. Seq25_V]EQC47560.1 lanthionine synthetase C-like protein [Bacteriovorax sp. Seq25_V]
MIYNPERHEELINIDWDENKVIDCIESIFEDTQKNFDSIEKKTMYFGKAGALFGLLEISKFLDKPLALDSKNAISEIYKSYIENPDTESVVPSLYLGEVGILLVEYLVNPSETLEDKIFQLVKSNIENPTLEALWAAPGTMIAASWFCNKTKKNEWKELFVENTEFLISKLKEEREEDLIWQQDLYGKKVRYTGAGHGYFGNMFGILKNIELLKPDDKEYILSHIKMVLDKLAIEEDGAVNWAPVFPKNPEIKPLSQWCHGAPGIVNSLKLFPKHDTVVEDLLVKAGELIWRAGPLTKGIGICHGTDGNGFSFLQLYKRTGNEIWLDRARKFAMHCLPQRKNEYTLFTGDVGLALYLIACLEKTDNFPFLDDF